MTKNLLLSAVFLMACSLTGLAQTKDIVINEKTYKKLVAPGANHIRMARKADKREGIVRVKDAPHERIMFEKIMTQNPETGELPSNFRERELQFLNSNIKNFRSRTKSAESNWEAKGPYNLGGRTRALAVDVKDDNVILAGGVSGGMWRSDDQGKSWKKTTTSTDHQSVTAVAQDTREGFEHIWYYCSGEVIGNSASETGASYNGAGVFKSVDNGLTWFNVESTNQTTNPKFSETFDLCWNLSVDSQNGDVYLATIGKIWRLENIDGNSESETMKTEQVLHSYPNDGDDWSYYTDIISTPNGVKYATLSSKGGVHGFFRSVTGNKNEWTNITPVDFPSAYNRTVIAYAPSDENILYFLSQTSDDLGHNFWKMTWNNEGNTATWLNRSVNLPKNTDEDKVDGYSSQGSYNMVIKVAPDNENMVFIGGTNLHRSDDAFETKNNTFWIGGYATENNISSYANHHPDNHSLAFLSNNMTLISGHDGGLSITSDYKKKDIDTTPVDWISLNNGYLTSQSYAIGIDENDVNSYEVISGFQDNGTWLREADANGAYSPNWLDIGTGDGGFCSMHGQNDAFILTAQKGVTYLYVKGIGYNRIDPKDIASEDLLFINPYEVEANEENTIYFSGGTSLWRNLNIYDIPKYSDNTSKSGWEKLINTEQKDGGIVSAIESSFKPANRIYFGTSTGKIFKILNANVNQPEVEEITAPSMPSNAYINSIETNPENADYITVTFSNYQVPSIFYSEDGGETWLDVSGSLEIQGQDSKGNALNIGPSVRYTSVVNTKDGPKYYAATSIGLFETNELSSNTQWKQVDPNGIGNTVVTMIKSRKDGFVAVGTHGNGIFSTQLEPGEAQVDPAEPTDIIVVGIEDLDDTNTKLSIYPNPMVNDSRIEFPNKNNESCRLIVIDASGRVVRIIENITDNNVLINREQLKPGIHIINIEGEKMYKGKLLVK